MPWRGSIANFAAGIRKVNGTNLVPVREYYKGHGDEVMSSMKRRYGDKGGERVFYATANKRGMNRPDKKASKKRSKK